MKLHFTFAVMLTSTTIEFGLKIASCNLWIANRHAKSEWMVRFKANWSLRHLHLYRSCIFGSSYMDFFFIYKFPCITSLQYVINQQDAILAVLCLLTTTSMLCMFETPFLCIIRSTINCRHSHWCLSWVGME